MSPRRGHRGGGRTDTASAHARDGHVSPAAISSMSGGGGNEPFPTQGGAVGRCARAREAVTTAPRRLEVGRIGEVVPRADGVPEDHGPVRLRQRPVGGRDALGAHGAEPARPCPHRARSTSPRRSRCPACTPCSRTTTFPVRSCTGSSSPTSPCWRSTACATSGSRSCSSPRSIPSRRGGQPRRSRSSTSRSSRSSIRAAPPSRSRFTRTARRWDTATATIRARTSYATSSSGTAIPTRPRTSRSRASTRSGSRTRRSSAPSRASRSRTARAASTSTSPRSGCTSTATRSLPASASGPSRCGSTSPASAARSEAARTSRCRSTAPCSRCTPPGP